MSYRPIEFLGGILLYIIKGFKGKFSNYLEYKWSFVLGFLLIILFVLILMNT
jgi:hypothetical protein